MRETATFIINQNAAKVVHPFDYETYDLGLKMALTENFRFYEYEIIDNSPKVSRELTIRKNEKERVELTRKVKEKFGVN